MLIEIILFLFLGIFAGTFTGLAPGIHINLVGAILVSLATSIFLLINPIFLVVFIVSMSITHTFIDFIPSIFLGAPDDAESGLATLPGHELLLEGKGYEAVMLMAYGCLYGVFLIAISFIPLIFIIPKIYPPISDYMAYILIFISLLMIFVEKNKFQSLFVFLFTGILGYFVLNLPVNSLKEPLLPLLTGLFGTSMILMSIKKKVKIPGQIISKEKIYVPKKSPLIGSLIASPLCGFLPGLGGGQAAVFANSVFKTDKRGFLVLVGITNTFVMGISFITLHAINKTRTGSAVSIQELLGTLSFNILFLLIIVCLISGIISFYLTKRLARFFSKHINKIDYTLLSIAVLIIVSSIVLLFSGILGFFILILSSLTGIYCSKFNIRRTQFMGCLLLPTIILYLF